MSKVPTYLASPFLVIEESEIEDPLMENPEEAKVVKDLEDALTVFDAVGLCKFMGMTSDAQEITRIISAVTGWDFGVDEFRKIGERIYNLERAFNIREGLTRADDTLPKRLLEDPLPEGPAEGHVNNLDILLDPYYEFRGWDKTTGKPTPEKLKELGLDDVIGHIYGGECTMTSYADKPWLKSYKIGAFKLKTTIDYPVKPLFSILDETAEKFPGKDAYDYFGNRMKYRTLKRQVDSLANALVNLGVKKGDNIIVFLPTGPQFIISDFAVLKAGATLVPSSPLLKAPELLRQAGESDAETIFCLDVNLDLIDSVKEKTRLKNIIVTSVEDYSPAESEAITEIPGTYSFRKLIADHDPKAPEIEIDPTEDLAVLAFTGGSTGTPKGVMITHFQRMASILQGLPWMMAPLPTYRGRASSLLPIPIFHSYGHYLMQSCIYWGLKVFLVPDPRDTEMIAQLMNEYRPFLICMVPTQLLNLAQSETKIKRMPVMVVSAAAPLPTEVAKTIEEKIKMPVSEGYGLTECISHINISVFSKITRFAIFDHTRGWNSRTRYRSEIG